MTSWFDMSLAMPCATSTRNPSVPRSSQNRRVDVHSDRIPGRVPVEVDDDPNPELVGVADHVLGLFECAERGIDVALVGEIRPF